MGTLVKTPTSILEEDINDLFKKKEESDLEILFSVITLLLFKNEKNTDMIDLYNNFGIDTFLKIVHLFDGRTVKFIDSKDLSDTLVLAVCYYLREIEGKRDWNDIQEFFGSYKLDRLSLALKIHNIDEWLKQKIQEQFKHF